MLKKQNQQQQLKQQHQQQQLKCKKMLSYKSSSSCIKTSIIVMSILFSCICLLLLVLSIFVLLEGRGEIINGFTGGLSQQKQERGGEVIKESSTETLPGTVTATVTDKLKGAVTDTGNITNTVADKIQVTPSETAAVTQQSSSTSSSGSNDNPFMASLEQWQKDILINLEEWVGTLVGLSTVLLTGSVFVWMKLMVFTSPSQCSLKRNVSSSDGENQSQQKKEKEITKMTENTNKLKNKLNKKDGRKTEQQTEQKVDKTQQYYHDFDIKIVMMSTNPMNGNRAKKDESKKQEGKEEQEIIEQNTISNLSADLQQKLSASAQQSPNVASISIASAAATTSQLSLTTTPFSSILIGVLILLTLVNIVLNVLCWVFWSVCKESQEAFVKYIANTYSQQTTNYMNNISTKLLILCIFSTVNILLSLVQCVFVICQYRRISRSLKSNKVSQKYRLSQAVEKSQDSMENNKFINKKKQENFHQQNDKIKLKMEQKSLKCNQSHLQTKIQGLCQENKCCSTDDNRKIGSSNNSVQVLVGQGSNSNNDNDKDNSIDLSEISQINNHYMQQYHPPKSQSSQPSQSSQSSCSVSVVQLSNEHEKNKLQKDKKNKKQVQPQPQPQLQVQVRIQPRSSKISSSAQISEQSRKDSKNNKIYKSNNKNLKSNKSNSNSLISNPHNITEFSLLDPYIEKYYSRIINLSEKQLGRQEMQGTQNSENQGNELHQQTSGLPSSESEKRQLPKEQLKNMIYDMIKQQVKAHLNKYNLLTISDQFGGQKGQDGQQQTNTDVETIGNCNDDMVTPAHLCDQGRFIIFEEDSDDEDCDQAQGQYNNQNNQKTIIDDLVEVVSSMSLEDGNYYSSADTPNEYHLKPQYTDDATNQKNYQAVKNQMNKVKKTYFVKQKNDNKENQCDNRSHFDHQSNNNHLKKVSKKNQRNDASTMFVKKNMASNANPIQSSLSMPPLSTVNKSANRSNKKTNPTSTVITANQRKTKLFDDERTFYLNLHRHISKNISKRIFD